MDLFKKSTSRNIPTFKNLYLAEAFLHDLAGMDTITSRNVEVAIFGGEPVNIRTHFINFKDRKSKPYFILVHGFGAASSMYFPIWKALSEVFCVIALDVIGMGSSSRPADLDFKKVVDP
jgi:pimeloyl-ACP methyl ester carboxylesterase